MTDRKDSVCALLVGEYDDSRLLIHEIFRDCGWRLIEARDRKAALDHLDRERIHVVITNSESPGCTWRQLLRMLSQRIRPPQLIVTSRTADDHLWSEVLNCGGYDVLPEPFRRDEIERVVASARRHYDPQPLRAMSAASARTSVGKPQVLSRSAAQTSGHKRQVPRSL